MTRSDAEREAWQRVLRAKSGRAGKGAASLKGVPSRNLKGLGPNKASGHKGGMGRQGSKRG